jgi:hypothetical protein
MCTAAHTCMYILSFGIGMAQSNAAHSTYIHIIYSIYTATIHT